MKATEYTVKVFNKNNEEYTKFIMGSKINLKMEKLIMALGGKFIKQTKTAKHYEVKGNQIKLMALCY
ncbi:hypothetical protein [Clostridium akagii]|uniref:hypothetical protein n=1 Tax=Clostridium akagii TaxID=91623 RepID=UPI00047B838D|nr:hypothetical protein [Clostridium akagii]